MFLFASFSIAPPVRPHSYLSTCLIRQTKTERNTPCTRAYVCAGVRRTVLWRLMRLFNNQRRHNADSLVLSRPPPSALQQRRRPTTRYVSMQCNTRLRISVIRRGFQTHVSPRVATITHTVAGRRTRCSGVPYWFGKIVYFILPAGSVR